MKSLLIATVSIGALTIGVAQAADMGVRRAGPAAVAAGPACAAAKFQGFHVGVNGGSVYHQAQRNDSDGFLTDNSGWGLSKWGGTAGGQIGYDWTTCNTLWGIEIDGSWVGVKNTFLDNPNATPDNFIIAKMNTFVTGRVRTGVALDNLLLYVTGGVAGAQFKTTWIDGADSATFKEWRFGWTAGFGTEWAWTPNWSLKSEVLYASFGDRDRSFTGAGPTIYSFRHSDQVWISRVGLNYRWGGAPVVARY